MRCLTSDSPARLARLLSDTCTRGTPWETSSSATERDGGSVAAQFEWKRRRPHQSIFVTGAQPRARALFKPLMDWHRWFMTWRNEGGAIVVTHPWETGRDNCPDWDGPFAAIEPEGVEQYYRRDTTHVVEEERPRRYDYDRYLYLVKLGAECGWDEAQLKDTTPFRVADPTMTFTLLRSTRDLKAMAERLDMQDLRFLAVAVTIQQTTDREVGVGPRIVGPPKPRRPDH